MCKKRLTMQDVKRLMKKQDFKQKVQKEIEAHEEQTRMVVSEGSVNMISENLACGVMAILMEGLLGYGVCQGIITGAKHIFS